MGLDQYLYANVRAPKGSPLAKVVEKNLTDDIRSAMERDSDYPGYQPYAYLSGWTYGDRESDPLYAALSLKMGFTSHEGSPHIALYDDQAGGYRVCPVVMYWRKANAIHRWFVDNAQNGVDECQYTPLSGELLVGLVDICEQITADPSKKELLTPTAGFFFGNAEYDDWFFADVKATAASLRTAMELIGPRSSGYIYHASW
jgi:hypothetical protein